MSYKRDKREIFVNTLSQKVLEVLSKNPDKELYDAEIHRMILDSSRAAVNKVLKRLYEKGLITRYQRGKINLNRIKSEIPENKAFKILSNIIEAKSLIAPAQNFISRAILFGSYSTGDNDSQSDIDIFVVSDEPDKARKKITHDEKLQLIIKESTELISLKKEDKEFWNQIEKGIVLWDKQHDDE